MATKPRTFEPNDEQLAALSAYAALHGRNWKARLSDAWMRAAVSGPLQQLRNQGGPSWLASFEFPAEDEASPKPPQPGQPGPHGTTIVAARPFVHPCSDDAGYVVLLVRDASDAAHPYVVAGLLDAQSTSWIQGDYHDDIGKAVTAFLLRSVARSYP